MPRDAQARHDQAADLNLDLVALSRNGPGPYKVQVELPVPWIAARMAHTDAEIQRPGAVDLEVTMIGDGASVLVRGTLDVDFVVPCARCLEPAMVTAGGDLCVHFVRGGAGELLRDEEDTEDDGDSDTPDQHTFNGNYLDLRPMVEEQILVAYPIRALCVRGEACRGLCMHCGANLNEQPPASRCAVCGTPGARVPVVAAPGYEEEPTPGRPIKPITTTETEPVTDSPWKAALRSLHLDPEVDPAAAPTGDAPGPTRKKPSA